jgi:hypothetical protein
MGHGESRGDKSLEDALFRLQIFSTLYSILFGYVLVYLAIGYML